MHLGIAPEFVYDYVLALAHVLDVALVIALDVFSDIATVRDFAHVLAWFVFVLLLSWFWLFRCVCIVLCY